MLTTRWAYGACLLACVGLMGFALYLQHIEGLEPCPMCIFQRMVVITLGTVSIVALVHNPVGWGRRIYFGIALALSVTGAALAARHVWIQTYPEIIECGPGLGAMLDRFPLTEVFSKVLRGTGDCADIVWTFLGLSIPGWTLIVFTLFLLISLFFVVRPPAST